MNPAFVFYDKEKSRTKKIKKGLHKLLGVFCLLSIFLFLAYNHALHLRRIDRDLIDEKQLIDEISTRKEDVIEVSGVGGLVTLEDRDDGNYIVREELPEGKRVLITFDDGPDPVYTPQILDVLKKEGIPAIFFVVGEQMLRHPEISKRIVDEGHVLGVHTLTHPSPGQANLYKDQERVRRELDVTQKIIIAQTGFKSTIFRSPHWGAEDTIELNTLVFIAYAFNRGYDILSSTVDSFDWQEKDPIKVSQHAVKLDDGSQIILMHDAGGDRRSTIEAIPQIAKEYRSRGYEFATTNEIVGVGKSYHAAPSIWESVSARATYTMLWFNLHYLELLKLLLTSGLGLVGGIMFLTIIFASLQILRKVLHKQKPFLPFVSVIVPAYNEEKSIQKTIKSLLKSRYPKFEIVVVDNNSTDKTAEKVEELLPHKKIILTTELTQGKFAALNHGISISRGQFVVIIDADTQITPNSLFHLIQPLKNKKIGAVAGNVKVGNLSNLLTIFQSIEYILGQQLERRAHDLFGATLVIPGAIGAWRKSAVIKAGGYTNDTLTEDAEVTVRIQRVGYKTAFAPKAVGITEAPEGLGQYLKQRQRWTFGILQVLFKNRDMIFNQKYGFLGMFLIPSIVFFAIPSMIIAPFIELIAVLTIIQNPKGVLLYFSLFTGLYVINVAISFFLANEKRLKYLLLVPVMRIAYHLLWYINFYRCLLTALKGEYVPWNKLHHLGMVELGAEVYPVSNSKYS